MVDIDVQQPAGSSAGPKEAPSVLPSDPRRENWRRRTFRPLTTGGLRASMLTLTSSALGAGGLAAPFAAKELGLGFAVIVLVSNGVISTLSSHILLTSTLYFNVHSYSMLFKRVVGVEWPIDLLIAFNGIGTCTSYLVFLGDFLPKSFQGFNSSIPFVDQILRSRSFALTASLFCVWPLSIQKKLSTLSHVSGIPVLSLLVTTAVILAKAPYLSDRAASLPNNDVVWFRLNWDWARGFSIFLYAFFQHMNCCTVAAEMQNPTESRTSKVAIRSLLLSITIYLPFTLCGYLSWREDVYQNVINNYPHSDPLITICRVLLSCSMWIAIPINMIATARSVKSLCGAAMRHPGRISRTRARASVRDQESASDISPNISSVSQSRSNSAITPIPYDGDAAPCDGPAQSTSASSLLDTSLDAPHNESQELHSTPGESQDVNAPTADESSATRIFIVTTCLLLCYSLALVTDQVGNVIGLVGGIFCTSLMCFCPAVIYHKGLSQSHSFFRRYVTLGALCAYTTIGAFATVVMLVQKFNFLNS